MATAVQVERRRSERNSWRIPLIVSWTREKTLTVREQGETEVVSAHGALLKISTRVPQGDIVTLMRPGGNPAKLARVATILGRDADGRLRLAVELDTPSLEFWVELAR